MPISIRVSVNMFAFSQVIVLVAFLATIVSGLPLNGGGLENIWPSEASRMPSRDIDRIFGGQAIGQFPYHISLQSRVFGNLYQVRCGGSIISNRFILTAGHCKPYGDDLSGLRVVVGAHWLNGTDFTAYNVSRFVVHEHLVVDITPTNATIINDIALIQTETVIQFNQLVAPIAVHSNFISGGVPAVVSYWGKTNVSHLLCCISCLYLSRWMFSRVSRFPG